MIFTRAIVGRSMWFVFPVLLIFLILVVTAACSKPASLAPSVTHPSKTPASTNATQAPAQAAPAASLEQVGWQSTQTFTGQDNLTTPPFHIEGVEWRITWATEVVDPRYATFNVFVYPNKPNALPAKAVSYSGGSGGDTIYIYRGGQDYYLKVIAANQKSWKVTVDDYVAEKATLSNSPVQIIHIKYQGKVYPPEPDKGLCYIRVEPDEYVEIKNVSDQPQDVRGWVLTNITKGYLQFIFPIFTPLAEGEYLEPMFLEPHQAVRVYTDEIHDESGGFSFNYGTGNYWNNEVPDTAVLLNAEGKEMSRRSYTVRPRGGTVIED
jgi:hypothetical protein